MLKGTLGHNVDANSWILDGKPVDDTLSKANGVARVYAGGIKANLQSGACTLVSGNGFYNRP